MEVCSHFSCARALRHIMIDRVKAKIGVFIFGVEARNIISKPPLAKPEVKCRLAPRI